MHDYSGFPLRPREPEYAADNRLWDGSRLYRLIDDDVRKHQSRLLTQAGMMVFNLLDCSPHSPRLGSKRLVTDAERAQLVQAGVVRFVEEEGRLQRWESDDGMVLTLLIGELRSPRLRS